MFFGAKSSTIQRIFTRSGKSLTISSFFSFLKKMFVIFSFFLFIFFFFFFVFLFLFLFLCIFRFLLLCAFVHILWEVVLVSSLLLGFLWAVFFRLCFFRWCLLGLFLLLDVGLSSFSSFGWGGVLLLFSWVVLLHIRNPTFVPFLFSSTNCCASS